MICDLVELVLALTDAVHHVDRHRREGEPADERDEEAACRGPESTHMRVLLDGAGQTEDRSSIDFIFSLTLHLNGWAAASTFAALLIVISVVPRAKWSGQMRKLQLQRP